MKRWIIGWAGVAALLVVGAHAQERFAQADVFGGGPGPRGPRPRMAPEDRAAFADARIAALHAGLKLTSDQEKLWPPVEEAIRALARQRRDAMQARRERFARMQPDMEINAIDLLRTTADRQAASAEALRHLADAAQPLYATLDEGQKRRLGMLTRGFRGGDRPTRAHGSRWGGREDSGRDFAFEPRPAR